MLAYTDKYCAINAKKNLKTNIVFKYNVFL